MHEDSQTIAKPVTQTNELEIVVAHDEDQLPDWAPRDSLARFFHEKMRPYHDRLEDVDRGLEYAFSELPGMGGFVLVAAIDQRLVGAVTVLRTGMKGYVPENLLLFIAVDPELRNRGIGHTLMEGAIRECDGSIKLHVEQQNPARRLYSRCGFQAKYIEMRYQR
jgi:GNAT superfamily N-acetyltransferase